MKILKDLIKKADDTLEEVWFYAKEATLLKDNHKSLADTYIEIGKTHIDIYGKLHDRMVAIIEEKRKSDVQVPSVMQEIWDYEHEKLVKEFAEAKYLLEEYKNA